MDTLTNIKSLRPEMVNRPEVTIRASQFIEITKTNTDEKIKGLILESDQILNKSTVSIEGRNSKVQTLQGDVLNNIKRSIEFSKKNPQERIDCTFFAAMASGTTNLKTRAEFDTDEDYASFFRTKYDWNYFIELNVGQMIVLVTKTNKNQMS